MLKIHHRKKKIDPQNRKVRAHQKLSPLCQRFFLFSVCFNFIDVETSLSELELQTTHYTHITE
jgi:hypothetical protein